MLNITKAILVLLFCCIGIFASSGISYIAFFIMISITCLAILSKPKFTMNLSQIEDFLPLIFFLVWFYGLIIGIIRHNKPQYIVANFAGMVVYLFYYVLLIFRIPKLSVFKTVFYAGVSISIITIVIFYLNRYNVLSLYQGWSGTGQARVFITILATGYVPWIYTFSLLFISREKRNILKTTFNIYNTTALLIFLISSYALIFVCASRGFTLAILFYFLFLPFLFYWPKFLKGKLNEKLPIFLVFIFLLFIVFSSLGYGDIVTKLFAKADISNRTRYSQLDLISADFHFLGNGLGATIKGVVRSLQTPYGFELIYVNLIHKFGFMSVFLFVGWIYLFIKIMIKILKGNELLYSIAALGALGYMFPSLGNPLLMHPACVMLNCIAFYLTRKPLNENINRYQEIVPEMLY